LAAIALRSSLFTMRLLVTAQTFEPLTLREHDTPRFVIHLGLEADAAR
jgi:hypothetical protein